MKLTFGIIANPDKYAIRHAVDRVVQWSSVHKCQLIISPKLNNYVLESHAHLSVVESELAVVQQSDYVISIGGDGTILWTAQLMTQTDPKPILGINSGRLGFMASTALEKIDESLTAIKQKTIRLDRRFFLESKHPILGHHFALNEFLFAKKDSASMITVKAIFNGELINNYWADGLIVSTPTGSTAYNLSSGGPIVMPGTDVLILTPITPHTLTTRPLVLPSNGKLEVIIDRQNSDILFSYDGNNVDVSRYPLRIEIQKSERYIDIVELPNHSFFGTLRTKLMWGRDARD
ncbi:hypothetical protein EP331_01655 [bacterium]|nr:MAG: hypothetical protein EP331_01655 [bacterium]